MKKRTRFIAFLLGFILIATLFAGCQDSKTPSVSPTEPASAGTDKPTEQPEQEGYVYRMPIAEDMYTISAWRSFSSTYLTSPNEILANIQLEKNTNIHLDYVLAPSADAATQYNLMLTSGTYTDIIFQGANGGTPNYIGGIDKAIGDGVFLDLSEAVDKWMPTLKGFMESNADINKQIRTDSGNIGAIACIQNGNEPAWVGPMIREDFLDSVGLDMPQTYDQLYTVLKAFKGELNIERPMSINYLGYTWYHSLTAGYDVAPDFYNENGTVKFGFIEDGFKDYITMMNKWYSEGLIDKEFYTRTNWVVSTEDIAAGKVGVADASLYSYVPTMIKLTTDPNFNFVGMPLPRTSADKIAHFRRVNEITGTSALVVTTAVDTAEKLELVSRWIDYRFTEEGRTLLNYGIDGETFEYVDGQLRFNEAITNDPEGRSFSDMQYINTDSAFGAFYDWKRSLVAYTPDQLKPMDVWGDSSLGDWVMPPVSLTSEEAGEYSTIYADIQTLITEMIAQFVSGARPLSEFDSFVEQIKSMNIDRCIELQQAALTRYLNR